MSKFLIEFLLKPKSDFLLLFFTNEYKTLVGKSNKRVLALFTILLLTFLALAFAIGSIEYLGKRMNNPFTNWVDMPVLYKYQDMVPQIRNYFDDEVNKGEYNLKNITEYSKFSPEFYDQKSGELYFVTGITLNPRSEIISKVLENNRRAADTLLDENNNLKEQFYDGVFVTRRMLKDLGYENISEQKKIMIDEEGQIRFQPIIAIVDELPGLSGFACTPRLYNWMSSSWEHTNCIDIRGKTNFFYFLTNINKKDSLKKELIGRLPGVKIAAINQDKFQFNSTFPLYRYKIMFNDRYDSEELNKLFLKIKAILEVEDNRVFWFPDWQCKKDAQFDEIDNPYYLAFNFNELGKVRAFKEFMLQDFGVEISMNQVEAKENFSVISNLTWIISSGLFLFGTISILLYVQNLLKNHLERIKPNLGTVKAFGLKNEDLLTIYRNIILSFLSISILYAFTVTCLIVGFEELISNESCLNIFNFRVLLAIILLLFVSYFIINNTIKKILSHTPGDLIYNRT